MGKFLATILGLVAGMFAGWGAGYINKGMVGIPLPDSAMGAIAGAVVGGLVAAITGGGMDRRDDTGVRVILGVVAGAVGGFLSGDRFELAADLLRQLQFSSPVKR